MVKKKLGMEKFVLPELSKRFMKIKRRTFFSRYRR
tara:strand:+ start:106 stop:210 length:105 start_codon:yes stop_codon:yes gene_type:complete